MVIKNNEILEDALNGLTGRPYLDHNTSPISKLHHDILLEIFQINANMDQDSPLGENQPPAEKTPRAINTTRNSSQVASLWRYLIVNSPTTWAGLIDLDILDSAGENWREDVLRRTQNSSLHVKGSISLKSLGDSEPWWLGFFNDNWTRIREFDLVVKTGVRETNWFPQFIILDYARAAKYRKALPFLARSTSILESFRIFFPYLCDPLELGSTLFDNHAPQLRVFRSQSLQFDTQAPWILRLQSLHVHEYTGQAFKSVAALYQILSRMPLLESLSIEDAIDFASGNNAPVPRVPIHFPRLRYLNIRGIGWNGRHVSDTFALWNLLNHIIPQPDCSVRLALSIPTTTRDIDLDVLSRLAENYFKVHASTYLELSASNGKFRLTDQILEETLLDAPIAKMPFFDLTFYYDPDYSRVDIRLYDIFEVLFFLSFPKVLDLHLEIGDSQRASFSNPRFGQLLSSLSAAEKITTTPGTLRLLCISPVVDISTLFPGLKVLKMPLGRPQADFETDMPAADILKSFLVRRREAGVPVPTFEYQCMSSYEKMEDISFLEDVPDLKTIWETVLIGCGEYICGSGRSEELNFAKKWELADAERQSQLSFKK